MPRIELVSTETWVEWHHTSWVEAFHRVHFPCYAPDSCIPTTFVQVERAPCFQLWTMDCLQLLPCQKLPGRHQIISKRKTGITVLQAQPSTFHLSISRAKPGAIGAFLSSCCERTIHRFNWLHRMTVKSKLLLFNLTCFIITPRHDHAGS